MTKQKIKRKQHELYPSPGAHVLDEWSGMPRMTPPDPLPKRMLQTIEIRDDYIAYEGIGECVFSYIPPNRIGDAKLRKLWKEARKALVEIVDYLEACN